MSGQRRMVAREDMRRLIALVRQHKALYDCSDPCHKENNIAYWDAIAKKMGYSDLNGLDWKKKWRNQRDVYKKKMRLIRIKKTGEDVERAKRWTFLKQMSFLDKVGYSTLSSDEETQENGSFYDGCMDGIYLDVDDNGSSVSNMEREDSQLNSPSLSFLETMSSGNATCVKDEESRLGEALALRSSDLQGKNETLRQKVFTSNKRARQSQSNWPAVEIGLPPPKVKTCPDVAKSALDLFFESCALRAAKLSPTIQSCLMLQVSQLFYNAENPSLPQSPIMPLPVATAVGYQNPLVTNHDHPEHPPTNPTRVDSSPILTDTHVNRIKEEPRDH